MSPFIKQAKRYALKHNDITNWYTHFVGIPVIVFSLMIFLGFFHIVVPNVFDIKFADLAVLAILIYYFRLNWLIAAILTPVFLIMLWLAGLINDNGPTTASIWTFFILLIFGVACQLVGHVLEGNKPAFMQHFSDSFAAPMFITAEALFMLGWLPKLKAEVYGKDTPQTKASEKRKKK